MQVYRDGPGRGWSVHCTPLSSDAQISDQSPGRWGDAWRVDPGLAPEDLLVAVFDESDLRIPTADTGHYVLGPPGSPGPVNQAAAYSILNG